MLNCRAVAADWDCANRPRIVLAIPLSPDGTKIAFTSGRSGNDEIYVMNADGTMLVKFFDDLGYEEFPAWSPDGKWLVYTSDGSGRQSLYRSPAAHRLMASRCLLASRPSWTDAGRS